MTRRIVTWTCPNCGTAEEIHAFSGKAQKWTGVFEVPSPDWPRPTPPPAAPQLPPCDPTLIGTNYGPLRHQFVAVAESRNRAEAKLAAIRAVLDETKP